MEEEAGRLDRYKTHRGHNWNLAPLCAATEAENSQLNMIS